MEQVVPRTALLKVIEPHYLAAGCGRRPYPLEAMLRLHLMQNWFALSDPEMEEALYEIASLRNVAGLKLREAIPDETTIPNFRYMLEESDLAEDIFKQVNAHLSREGLLLTQGRIVLLRRGRGQCIHAELPTRHPGASARLPSCDSVDTFPIGSRTGEVHAQAFANQLAVDLKSTQPDPSVMTYFLSAAIAALRPPST